MDNFYKVDSEDVNDKNVLNPLNVKKAPLCHVSLMHSVAKSCGTDLRKPACRPVHTSRLMGGATDIVRQVMEKKYQCTTVGNPKKTLSRADFIRKTKEDIAVLDKKFA